MSTVSAFDNPDLVNKLAEEAMNLDLDELVEPPIFVAPRENIVTLPGGFTASTGEVVTEAEVRELTGTDEEEIVRAKTTGAALLTVLRRGTVKVGDQKASEKDLDSMLAGDRDAIMLGIYKATFGDTAEIPAVCETCNDVKTIQVNIDEDIEVKYLEESSDRYFTVEGKDAVYTVGLPTGATQKLMYQNIDKSYSELTSLLLENCVLQIDGRPVISPKRQIGDISILDRRKIAAEIAERNCGPKTQDVKVECPDCGSEVEAPVSLGSLFQF